MEKEQKIAERERLAEEMSLFGRLRQFYPSFALFYISVLRLVLWYVIAMPMRSATFIFPTQCLTIYNMPVTLALVFASQTLVGNLIAQGFLWPVPADVLVFNLILCALLGVLQLYIKSKKVKPEDKDPVFMSVVMGAIIFTALFLYAAPESLVKEDSTAFGTFFVEAF